MPNPKDPEKLAAYRLKMSQIAKEKGYGKWMEGRKPSPEALEKMSQAQKILGNQPLERERRSKRAKEKGYGKWMEGRTLPPEVKEKIVAHRRGKTYEEIYGPRVAEEAQKRRDSNRARFEGKPKKSEVARPKHNADYRYSEWRRSVFERDNFTCQVCGQKGGELHAHHLRSWAKYADLRFEINNGLTVCAKTCHKIKNQKSGTQDRGKDGRDHMCYRPDELCRLKPPWKPKANGEARSTCFRRAGVSPGARFIYSSRRSRSRKA